MGRNAEIPADEQIASNLQVVAILRSRGQIDTWQALEQSQTLQD